MHHLIEPIAGSQRALVFGVVWASVIGANPEREARRHARKVKAHFYTRARARSTVVGTLTFPRGRRTEKMQTQKQTHKLDLYSAAAAFARAYDRGAVAVHLPLRDGGVWVSAAVDGMVQIGTDVIHDSAAAAQQHLERLRQMHPALQVLGHEAGEGRLQEGVFLDNLTEAVRLQRVATTLPDLPPLFWLGISVLASLLIWQIVSHYRTVQQQTLLQAGRTAPTIDPVSAWQAALHTWSQGQTMHGMSAVNAMLASIARLPVSPGRWELDTIDCQPTRCQALYRRTRLADNPSLQAALPSAWPIQWIDMDNASVSVPTHWQGDQRGDVAAMPDEHTYVEEVLAHWQRLHAAMQDIRIGPKTAVALAAPLAADADGNLVPVPLPPQSDLQLPMLREVTIHAPLRTIAVLAWPEQSQVSLLQVRRQPATDVDLTRSVFQAMLKGVIYVR